MTKTILHVIDSTGPGGAEVVFITLAERLAPCSAKVALGNVGNSRR